MEEKRREEWVAILRQSRLCRNLEEKELLGEQIEENPKLFDRVEMYQKCMKAVEGKAIEKIKCL